MIYYFFLNIIICHFIYRHLDISQADQKHGYYHNPNQTLAHLVAGLPELVSLDIGGTNLAGRGVAERPLEEATEDYGLCDIQGLDSRVNNPLQFLGLYGTRNQACRRHDIPAKIVSPLHRIPCICDKLDGKKKF